MAVEVRDTWLAGTRRRPAWTTPPCSSRWRASTPDFALINHARWDGNLALLMGRQRPKKTFRSYVLANLKANRMAAMPVLCRPACGPCSA